MLLHDSLLLITSAGIRGFLDDWAPAADVLVAAGTIALAAATFLLARQAKSETAKVTEQVDLERQQLEAGQRPFILPVNRSWNPDADAPWIELINAGTGPGYNVEAALFWPGGIGGGARILPTAIPADDDAMALLIGIVESMTVPWASVSGYVRYSDLASTEWLTHFRYRQTYGRFSAEVLAVGKTLDLGEPDYTLEDGWLNPPEPQSA